MRIFNPYPYQQHCINEIINKPDIGLFLDMGLGKTSITLAAIRELQAFRFEVGKVLIVAPKKVSESTWQNETRKWADFNGLVVSTILGDTKQRIRAALAPADIYVINRDNIKWLTEYFGNNWPFDMVVLDESTSFKNHRTGRFKSLKRVRPKISRLVCLTGTPSPNGIADLWAQIFLLDGGTRLEKSYSAFRERYFTPGARMGHIVTSYDLKENADRRILEKISDICVSMKSEDYIELPDVVYNTIPVILDVKAQQLYLNLEKQMILETEDKELISVTSAAALSNKLLQLSNGAVYDENKDVHEIHNCKVDAFLELVEGLAGKPVLVFYNFQHDRDRILKALANSGLSVRVYQDQRDLADWNNKKIDVLLAHPASTAYGLNMQDGGNHIVWFGLNWNYELYTQANKRLHRQGQTQKVIIHHLVTQGTRDDDVIAALDKKDEAQAYVLDSLKARIRKYTGETK